MSVKSPFYGKLQVLDTTAGIVWGINGVLGSGTQILVYKAPTPSPVPGYRLVTGQLESATAQPTRPGGLWESYLAPSPISAVAQNANGVGSNTPGGIKPTQFLYKETPNAQGPPTVSFMAYDGPPGGTFGLWALSTGGKFWGWSTAPTPPAKFPYAMGVSAPSAAYARTYLSGACPPGCDYTWCDLSEEDWSGLRLPGARFAGADLSGTDLGGCDLTGADFRGVAALAGADLTNTVLTNARFDGVDLTGMDFSGAQLQGAGFTGATLTNAVFLDTSSRKADLTGLDFAASAGVRGARFGTSLSGVDFTACDLTGVDFSGAVMKGTVFHRCDLRPAVFSSPPVFSDDPKYLTDLSQAVVDFTQIGKNWSFMNLTDTQILSLPVDLSGLTARSSLMTNWVLSNHKLYGAVLAGADLRGATLSECDLTKADLSSTQLQADSDYRAAILSGSQMENATLADANLTGTSLSGVYLWGTQASVAKALIRNTSFSGAYLTGISFVSVSQNGCKGADFSYACLVNADFTGTDLTDLDGQPVRMFKACLQGANFTNAHLDGADLTAAAVDENPGVLPVTIQNGWPAGNTVCLKISYPQGTTGIEKATTHATTCPAGSLGPCTGDALLSPQAPTSWPSSAMGSGKKPGGPQHKPGKPGKPGQRGDGHGRRE